MVSGVGVCVCVGGGGGGWGDGGGGAVGVGVGDSGYKWPIHNNNDKQMQVIIGKYPVQRQHTT